MRNLQNRVGRLEGPAKGAWVPAPEGAVMYAGKRDPDAIVRALGLDHMPEVALEVLSVGAVPGEPPELVGGKLTKSGRFGMFDELRAFDEKARGHFLTGAAWSLHWWRGGKWWALDNTGDGPFCRWSDDAA